MNLDNDPIPQEAGGGTDTTILQVTYDDPELIALGRVATSSWCENLKEVLISKTGRMTLDFWGLGLPEPQEIESISIIDNRYLLVQAVVVFDENSDLDSILNDISLQSLKIKSIVVSKEPKAVDSITAEACPVTPSNSTVTTILDYVSRRFSTNPSSTEFLFLPPSETLLQSREFNVPNRDHGIPTHAFPGSEVSRKVASYIATPPVTPSPAMRRRRPRSLPTVDRHYLSRDSSPKPEQSQSTSIRSDSLERFGAPHLEPELPEEFESILQERMTELQTAFNIEKCEFEERIESLRTDFDSLLAQRVAEAQIGFNKKEEHLHARIANAEEEAARERSLRLCAGARVPEDLVDQVASFYLKSQNLPDDFSIERHVSGYNPSNLELKMEDLRLKDTRRQLEGSEAQLSRSTRQLEKLQQRLQWHRLALAYTKHRLANAEERTTAQDEHLPFVGDGSQDGQDMLITQAEGASDFSDRDEPENEDRLSQSGPCLTCEFKKRSASLSELHVRAMELRVAMFERRVIQTESHAVSLLVGLQAERQKRKQLEGDLDAEIQRRLDAEAGAEAVARETRWPFVVPGLLGLFLKFEGLVDEVVGVKGRE